MILFKSYQIYIFYQSGRVISDPGRGIALIEWSEAGYPLRIITDAGEHIRYRYSASGVKLSESYLDAEGTPLGTRELCGCFELADGKVNRVHVPGDTLTPSGNCTCTCPTTRGAS